MSIKNVLTQELIYTIEKQISKSLQQVIESNYFNEQKIIEINHIIENCRKSFNNIILNPNEFTFNDLSLNLEKLAVIDGQWNDINEQKIKEGKKHINIKKITILV